MLAIDNHGDLSSIHSETSSAFWEIPVGSVGVEGEVRVRVSVPNLQLANLRGWEFVTG